MGIKFSQLPIATEVASNDYVAMLDTSEEELKRIAINHASSGTAFGLGTADEYGHTKIVDDLTKSTFADGEALSAHQGNVLANLIAQKNVPASSDEMVGMVEQNTLLIMFKFINEQGLTTEGLPDNVVYIASEDSDKYMIELGGNNPEIFA